MWKGRFQEETSALLQQYSESISFDWRLWRHDIEGSIAHSAALEAAGLITAEEREKIVAGLREIGAEIEARKFQFKTELEDIHMNIEAELTRRIGDAGAKLHTARSRNDQIARYPPLPPRESTRSRSGCASPARAGESPPRIATCSSPATRISSARRNLCACASLTSKCSIATWAASRCAQTLNNVLRSAAPSPAPTIPLDRDSSRSSRFPPSANRMDAVSDRDFAVALLAVLALVAMHLSRLSEDVILWASSEFQFVILSDAYTTGSSLMPQKKNPDVAELTRGKTGRVFGNLVALLTTLKGLPMTYNRDMQEDKEPVFDSVDTVKAALTIFAGMLRGASVNATACAAAGADPMLSPPISPITSQPRVLPQAR